VDDVYQVLDLTAEGGWLPTAHMGREFHRPDVRPVSAKSDVGDGVILGPRLDDQKNAMTTHAKVSEATLVEHALQ
jgi:hypothetical protein